MTDRVIMSEIRRAEKPFTHPLVKLLIGKKIAKQRPVISMPKPVNPINLHGRKWRNVIVTIPTVETPPVRPDRKKRKSKLDREQPLTIQLSDESTQSKSSLLINSRSQHQIWYTNALMMLSSLQLHLYLRLAKTAMFITPERASNLASTCLPDLYFFSRASESRMSKARVVSVILRKASLTNEPSDTGTYEYFRHDDANTNGFKNFSPHTGKRDLDKLKFWKMCRPLRRPPRRSSLRAKPKPTLSSTINDVNESAVQLPMLDELTHRANTKTNRNRNTAICHRGDIKKVWRRIKKNSRKMAINRSCESTAATTGLRDGRRQFGRQEAGWQPHRQTHVRVVTDEIRSILAPSLIVNDDHSHCSISDSPADFPISL